MKIIPLAVFLFLAHLHLAYCPNDNKLYIPVSKSFIEIPKIDINWEREFNRWEIDMGFSESGNNWTVCNSIGCMGLFQFQQATLERLGFTGITPEEFRINPNIFPLELQKKALKELIKINATDLKDLNHFIGDTINDVLITKSGLLAAAHLAGVKGVRNYLVEGKNPKDMNGTSVADYLKKFQGYNI